MIKLIFLYKFDVNGKGIDFVLNEGIAEDMYPDLETMLSLIVRSTCETLIMYKHLSKRNPIMEGRILDTNEFEVMLSEGLGQHIDPYTKNQILFENAKIIADILAKVMERRSLERRNAQ